MGHGRRAVGFRRRFRDYGRHGMADQTRARRYLHPAGRHGPSVCAAGLHRTDGPERCRALPAKLVYALQRAARAGNHAAGIISENHHPAPAFL